MGCVELAEINERNTGFAKLIGLEITHCTPERVTAVLEVGSQHLQPAGIVNGGVYASIGETVGSLAAIVAGEAPAVGMSNYTDFLKPVSSGTIEAEATPVHVGRTTHLWRIEMRNEGKLVAVTQLKLMMMR